MPEHFFMNNVGSLIPATLQLPTTFTPTASILKNIEGLSTGSHGPWSQTAFIPSPAKLDVINCVEGNLLNLVANTRFTGSVGTAARLLIGEKGIGKSHTLRRCVLAATLAFPNVICVYADYASDLQEPVTMMIAALKARNIICDDDPTSYFSTRLQKITQLLVDNGLYFLLLADEVVDQLYAVKDTQWQTRIDILKQLAALGGQPTGRFMTLLCGSASLLPSLISKNVTHLPLLEKEFPLVSSAPNMNGTKFKSFRIRQGPLAFTILQQAFEVFLGRPVSEIETNRLSFVTGSNMRRIEQVVIDAYQNQQFISSSESLLPFALWDERAEQTRTDYGVLIDAITHELITRNKALLKRTYKLFKKTNSLEHVGETKWTEELHGIPIHELRKLLGRLRPAFSINHVHMIVDKGWFCADTELVSTLPLSGADIFSSYCQVQDRSFRLARWFGRICSADVFF
jgi:hypothetical protein